MALSKPQVQTQVRVPQVSTFEPFGCFSQFSHTGIDVPGPDLSITMYCACHHNIVRGGCDFECLIATLESKFEIALLNGGRGHAPPADRLEPKILKGAAVLQRATAIAQTRFPFSQGICAPS